MKTIRHTSSSRDKLLHIETDGAIINIQVGLSDAKGRNVTSVTINPDDESRGFTPEQAWRLDGSRLIQNSPPLPSPTRGVTPHTFLDLSSQVLPEQEMTAITASPARVIDHEYGAWVNVPQLLDGSDDDLAHEDWDDYPVLRNVLLAARELGAWWVNIDVDGNDIIAGLPLS